MYIYHTLLSDVKDAMADAADATNESMRCSSILMTGTIPPVFFTYN
jgi:CRISPR/Cas system-associated endonuclease/helicase Cas3